MSFPRSYFIMHKTVCKYEFQPSYLRFCRKLISTWPPKRILVFFVFIVIVGTLAFLSFYRAFIAHALGDNRQLAATIAVAVNIEKPQSWNRFFSAARVKDCHLPIGDTWRTLPLNNDDDDPPGFATTIFVTMKAKRQWWDRVQRFYHKVLGMGL